tara:strand:- start:247 stop:450 length:204 start_codon:yes stop_codon:yes gene_type:complete
VVVEVVKLQLVVLVVLVVEKLVELVLVQEIHLPLVQHKEILEELQLVLILPELWYREEVVEQLLLEE